MPWVSTRDEMESMESIVPHDPLFDQDSSWGDTFAAGVGQVFDEELSISASFNNEGYARRDDIAKQMRDDGFDFSPYTDDTGFIDYDRLSSETDFGIQSDLELYEQRNQTLERRRNYANDVFDRGSGFAQFAGSMTGYMLDPVNVATLPIGASASALRGLSTMARVSRVMATEAAIGATAEAIIQPLVYAHKNEIGSPYELDDAIAAISTAAIGGAVLGGAAAGVAGFARRVANIDLPDTPEVSGSREILTRYAADLEANPKRVDVSQKVQADADRFIVKSTDDLVTEVADMKVKVDGGDAPLEVRQELEVAESVLKSRKGRWGKTVDAEIAAGDTKRTKRLTEDLGRIENNRLVEEDMNYARTLEDTRKAQSGSVSNVDNFRTPDEVDAPPVDDLQAAEAVDLNRYEAMGTDGVVMADGEMINARGFIDERTAEIDGLESVRVCAYG